MGVLCLEGDLGEPFQGIALFPVILDAFLRISVVEITQPNPQPKPLRQGSIRNPSENVMPFKVSHPAAEEASRLASLDD